MAQTWKHPPDLKPGDVVRCLRPIGRARVISSAEAPGTMTGLRGAAPVGNGDDTAWLIDFELIDGMERGRHDYVYLHPKDKVSLG